MDYKKVLEDFLKLQRSYQFERRTLMTKERFVSVAKSDPERGLNITDESLNEPLIEHVGHLPIIASYFYPYLENVAKIDLGRVLVMLSVHDIGETELGDVFAYTKSATDEKAEVEAARKLIHPSLLSYFEEYEALETFDAKYAKAVDAIAPMVHGIDLPKLTFERFLLLGADLEDIRKKKGDLFSWDTTMQSLYMLIMEQAERIQDGKEPVLSIVEYDLK